MKFIYIFTTALALALTVSALAVRDVPTKDQMEKRKKDWMNSAFMNEHRSEDSLRKRALIEEKIAKMKDRYQHQKVKRSPHPYSKNKLFENRLNRIEEKQNELFGDTQPQLQQHHPQDQKFKQPKTPKQISPLGRAARLHKMKEKIEQRKKFLEEMQEDPETTKEKRSNHNHHIFRNKNNRWNDEMENGKVKKLKMTGHNRKKSDN